MMVPSRNAMPNLGTSLKYKTRNINRLAGPEFMASA